MQSHGDPSERSGKAAKLQGFVIRAATPTDAEAITRLANLPGYRHGTLRLPFQSVAETRHYLDSPSGESKNLVADLDGEIIGDIGLTMGLAGRRRHVASIGMGVHDGYVNLGVGSSLLVAVLDVADNWLNLRRVELTVFTDNEKAIRLYKKNGFVIEGCAKDFAFRNGGYVDVYAMARLRT